MWCVSGRYLRARERVCVQVCAMSPSVCASECLCFCVFFFLSEFCEVVAGVYSNENACVSLSPLSSH